MGSSILLTIFAALCLTIFAVLSVSTAHADWRMGQTMAKAAAAFYEADEMAETIFARLRNGEIPPEVSCGKNRYTYSCPAGGSQYLWVELEKDGDNWKVICWKTVSGMEYEEINLPVWDGR